MACFLIGSERAARGHAFCVVDQAGAIVLRFGFAHSERGIGDALARLADLAPANGLAGAIERPGGLLVERDARTRELQALSRLRDDQVEAAAAATNQPAALLEQRWPGAKGIFSRLDCEIALDVLERYPTAKSAASLGEARLAGFLRRHSYSGRRSPSEPLARLRTAPRPVACLDPEIVAELVRAQARPPRTPLRTIADLDRTLAAGVAQHDKARTLAPLPRIGAITLGQVVAEVGPFLERVETVEQAAAGTRMRSASSCVLGWA